MRRVRMPNLGIAARNCDGSDRLQFGDAAGRLRNSGTAPGLSAPGFALTVHTLHAALRLCSVAVSRRTGLTDSGRRWPDGYSGP